MGLIFHFLLYYTYNKNETYRLSSGKRYTNHFEIFNGDYSSINAQKSRVCVCVYIDRSVGRTIGTCKCIHGIRGKTIPVRWDSMWRRPNENRLNGENFARWNSIPSRVRAGQKLRGGEHGYTRIDNIFTANVPRGNGGPKHALRARPDDFRCARNPFQYLIAYGIPIT